MALIRVLADEFVRTVRHPARLRHLLHRKRWVYVKQRLTVSDKWETVDAGEGVRRRRYGRYEDYVAHQRSKLAHLDAYLAQYDVNYRQILRDRLAAVGVVTPGSAVLCLAARIGTEVKAFLDLGCFAVGIDLNPGDDNHYVVVGDFHHLQYPDACVDFVFSNSFDHALHPEKFIAEAMRVLKPGGHAIWEFVLPVDDDHGPGEWQAFAWDSNEDAIALFTAAGFTEVRREPFDKPWRGIQVYLRKPDSLRPDATLYC
jgi:SAM-dependent methyltransferase